ncbi:MAG TPA: hypothetical protein VGI03_08640 [Verrucomicrobiae bacterium]|jgi:hypothetical protein
MAETVPLQKTENTGDLTGGNEHNGEAPNKNLRFIGFPRVKSGSPQLLLYAGDKI